MSGMLVLIAGPSGAGKDTLMRLARMRLRDDPRFVFVRRVITRPSEAAGDTGEDHEPALPEDFARREESGAFALSWGAHGLCYGVPRSIEHELSRGHIVIVNVSRAVIAAATERYPNTRVVIVTAPLEMLAARLAARGREPPAELQGRLARPDFVTQSSVKPHYISNDRKPEDGAAALIAFLQDCLAAVDAQAANMSKVEQTA
jgi:ribose 1,5-bisphosphokinase